MNWLEVMPGHYVNMDLVTDVAEGADGSVTLYYAFYDQDAVGPASMDIEAPYAARVLAWVRKRADIAEPDGPGR